MARRTFVRGGRARRQTQWGFIGATSTTLAAASSATLVASLNSAGLALRPFTVVRSIIEIGIKSDQSAAGETQVAAVGMAVVSDQAVAVGITAVPTPASDAGSDLWFAHQWLLNDFSFISGVGVDERMQKRYTIDSKAMRKVEEGSDFVLVAENDAISAGSIIVMAGRFLIKLH